MKKHPILISFFYDILLVPRALLPYPPTQGGYGTPSDRRVQSPVKDTVQVFTSSALKQDRPDEGRLSMTLLYSCTSTLTTETVKFPLMSCQFNYTATAGTCHYFGKRTLQIGEDNNNNNNNNNNTLHL